MYIYIYVCEWTLEARFQGNVEFSELLRMILGW